MSGTKIKKAILREMIAADLKAQGITRAPKVESTPANLPARQVSAFTSTAAPPRY
jgi:hypothetical protein